MNNSYQYTLNDSYNPNERPLIQIYNKNINGIEKRYYSSTDASIYFGDFFIEEATGLTYEISESAMMLFGYNSYVFDDIAKGARMIQGQFSIDFTTSGYLFNVLNKLSEANQMGAIMHSSNGPLWPTGFDLFIKHGTDSIKNDLQIVCIQSAYITGCSTIYDARSGEPIKEIYNFVAKDINYGLKDLLPTPNISSYHQLEIVGVIYKKEDKKITIQFNQPISFKSGHFILDSNAITSVIEQTSLDSEFLTFDTSVSDQKTIEQGKTLVQFIINYTTTKDNTELQYISNTNLQIV